MQRYNPFRPGSIVGPAMFVGRWEELEKLERALYQTKNGNPQNFLINGERGIGKSSLFLVVDRIASGRVDSINHGKFRFLTVNVELEPENNYHHIISKIGGELQRAVAGHQRATELAKTVWDFLKRWEVAGVKYHAEERTPEPHELLDNLTDTLERTVSALNDEFDGIVILIDEADKPPASANLGQFVKLFTEKLTKRGCERVCLGLAGLPGLTQRLRLSHDSAPRIFEIFSLEPLLPDERAEVVRRGLQEADKRNGFTITVTSQAEKWISEFSEGYPNFIQQFAYCAFEADDDNVVDHDDVLNGALGENGAFEQLGQKYFHELYFEQIGSDEYREVLRVMADHVDEWITKDQIRKAAKIKEYTLNNAVAALTKRRIIIPKQGSKGVYRLPTKSFAVWIKSLIKAQPSTG